MKKINKKGFTLIELLAVLVVLAVIALITVPIVLKIINNAKSQSAKSSIEGYASAAENGLSDWQMMNPGKATASYDFSNITTKGNSVTCQSKHANSNGKISLGCCTISGDSKYYNYSDGKVSVSNSCDTLNKQDDLLEVVTVENDNSEYFVIGGNDSSTNYVTLLRNNSIGNSVYYTSDTCTQDLLNDSGCTTSYSSSFVKPIVDSWASSTFSNNELVTVDGYRARLINLDDVEVLHYVANDSNWRSTDIYSSSLNLNYWTMIGIQDILVNTGIVSPVNQNHNSLTHDYIYRSHNINPVINIKKEFVD